MVEKARTPFRGLGKSLGRQPTCIFRISEDQAIRYVTMEEENSVFVWAGSATPIGPERLYKLLVKEISTAAPGKILKTSRWRAKKYVLCSLDANKRTRVNGLDRVQKGNISHLGHVDCE